MWWFLAACVREVHIETVPAGAMITVAGKRARPAPLDVTVARGKPVAITAALPGYRVLPATLRAPLLRRQASVELRLVAETTVPAPAAAAEPPPKGKKKSPVAKEPPPATPQ